MNDDLDDLVVGEEPPAVRYTTALAEHLGEGWTVRDDRPRWHSAALLLGPQGEEVSVRLGSEQSYSLAAERGRVLMHGIIPSELTGFFHGRSPEITVSAQKPAFVVAKELKRRLLDDYRQKIANAKARKHDHDQRETERAELVDQAAAALAVLGPVTVWDRDRDQSWNRGPSGKLSVGGYRDRVQIELEVTTTYSALSSLVPEAKAKVTVHRELLPALTAALATLGGAAPQPAGEAPAEVWVVHRADDDSMEAFQDEWRAKEYAAFYPGSVVDVLTPMSCSAAGQFFIDTVHGEGL